jgi:hypothetical protein
MFGITHAPYSIIEDTIVLLLGCDLEDGTAYKNWRDIHENPGKQGKTLRPIANNMICAKSQCSNGLRRIISTVTIGA